MSPVVDFLSGMVRRRRTDVSGAFGALSREALEEMAAAGRPVRDFELALTSGPCVAVIAEVKKASPSAGAIAPGVDARERALAYEGGGAAAVSVLTEPSAFGGSFDDLAAVTSAVRLPVLCKDFVVDDSQILVARSRGADAVLLMVSVLGEDVSGRVRLVRDLGMAPLVEVVSEEELDLALRAGAKVVGVNSRDLRTLEVDPARALALVARAKRAGITVVLASGIASRSGVEAAAVAGADAVLVGEALMRSDDPAGSVRALASVRRGGR